MVEVARDRFVGEEHELLDQLVGFVRGLFFDPVGFSLGIEEDTKLGEIEVEGALGKALPAKGGGKVPSALEKAVEIILSGATEAKKGFRIGEAVAGVDDRAGEAGGTGLAFGIEANKGGIGQALFIGTEGAEAVRKAGRKHGDDAVDEVDAVGAFAGFVIQFGSGFDVVGDVGDVNADLHVVVGKFAKGDGVVEIAGGVGVDGDDEVATKIFPSGRAVGEFDGGKRFGFGESFGRESCGEIEFPDDGEDVDAWIGSAAEAFDEEAFGVGSSIFPVDQFCDDFVAGFGLRRAFGTGGWDVEIVEKAGVVGDDDEEAGCFLESADDHGGAAFEDAVDTAAGAFRFGRAAATGGGSGPAIDAGDDEVAVEGGACIFGGDVKVGGSVGRNDEGKAFRVELDGACDEVCIAGGDVVGMSDAGNAALFFEGVEGAGNGGDGNAETFRESGRIQGGSLFALEEVKDAIRQLAGGGHRFQGIIVPRIDEYTIRCY
jgi:hypothetical protein